MNGSLWTLEEDQVMREKYPDVVTWTLARELGRRVSSVYGRASLLGLHKSDAFLCTPFSGRCRPGAMLGEGSRFAKGNVPANKGLRRPGYAPGRMAESQFKTGESPPNTMEIGSYRLHKSGTLQRKVCNARGSNSKRWRSVHELVWIEANGAVPKGHICVFKPGTRTNVLEEITLDKVECISFAENMRRNSVHNLPKSLAQVIQLRGAVVRQIHRRTKHEQNDRRSA